MAGLACISAAGRCGVREEEGNRGLLAFWRAICTHTNDPPAISHSQSMLKDHVSPSTGRWLIAGIAETRQGGSWYLLQV